MVMVNSSVYISLGGGFFGVTSTGWCRARGGLPPFPLRAPPTLINSK